jgi:hypothetical protein
MVSDGPGIHGLVGAVPSRQYKITAVSLKLRSSTDFGLLRNVGMQEAEAREYAAEHGYEVALRADSPCISGSLSLPSLK